MKSLGYDLVRVAMIGGTSDPTLQVMAERPDTRQLDLADCETHLAAPVRLARRSHDPIEGSYRLEVSSPGIDRPLTRLKDYADWAGHEARITLAEPRDGRKQFSGTLEGVDGETVKLTDKSGQSLRPAVLRHRVGQAALDRQAHQRHRAAQHRGRRHTFRP